ncbi:unnamed protein product, partial [Amoebophrya sp. A120]
ETESRSAGPTPPASGHPTAMQLVRTVFDVDAKQHTMPISERRKNKAKSSCSVGEIKGKPDLKINQASRSVLSTGREKADVSCSTGRESPVGAPSEADQIAARRHSLCSEAFSISPDRDALLEPRTSTPADETDEQISDGRRVGATRATGIRARIQDVVPTPPDEQYNFPDAKSEDLPVTTDHEADAERFRARRRGSSSLLVELQWLFSGPAANTSPPGAVLMGEQRTRSRPVVRTLTS